MSDPFATLIPTARGFLTELADNNSRDWFTAHKDIYDSHLKSPAKLFLDQIAHDLTRDHGWQVTPKLFRPHRDVRFSKDKTPYHTHLHLLWAIGGKPPSAPAVFFGVSPDYVTVGGGIMGFDKTGLTAWRAHVDVNGARIEHAITTSGFAPKDPDLKRVPAPYPPEHPQSDLLRRKSLTVWRDIDGANWSAPSRILKEAATALAPLLEELTAVT